jgi:hypothetical protein
MVATIDDCKHAAHQAKAHRSGRLRARRYFRLGEACINDISMFTNMARGLTESSPQKGGDVTRLPQHMNARTARAK